jgi:CheY-like chemotaxis protein
MEQRPEVIFLDIGLPVLDGYEVCRQARARGLSDARIIAMSGYGQIADREALHDAGFDSHSVKPVDLNELTRLLSQADPGGAP